MGLWEGVASHALDRLGAYQSCPHARPPQNAWWQMGNQSAPWCVGSWEANSRVPMGVPAFQRAFGLPFQVGGLRGRGCLLGCHASCRLSGCAPALCSSKAATSSAHICLPSLPSLPQLYAPYFCSDSPYLANWSMVQSDQTLPGCHVRRGGGEGRGGAAAAVALLRVGRQGAGIVYHADSCVPPSALLSCALLLP